MQNADHRHAGEQRRAAVAEERHRNARQRDHLDDARDDHERLYAQHGQYAVSQQHLEGTPCAGNHRHPTQNQQDIHRKQQHAEHLTQLFADDGEDEVVVIRGNLFRRTLPQPDAEQTARADGKQRLNNLIALVGWVAPWVAPHCHAHLDMRKHLVAQHGGAHAAAHADDRQRHIAAGDIEQHQRRQVIDERGAEVTLEHQQNQTRRRKEQRGHHLPYRSVCAEEICQHQHDGELDDLAGLKRTDKRKIHPVLCAVVPFAECQRQNERDDAQQHAQHRQPAEMAHMKDQLAHDEHDHQPRSVEDRLLGAPCRRHGIQHHDAHAAEEIGQRHDQ